MRTAVKETASMIPPLVCQSVQIARPFVESKKLRVLTMAPANRQSYVSCVPGMVTIPISELTDDFLPVGGIDRAPPAINSGIEHCVYPSDTPGRCERLGVQAHACGAELIADLLCDERHIISRDEVGQPKVIRHKHGDQLHRGAADHLNGIARVEQRVGRNFATCTADQLVRAVSVQDVFGSMGKSAHACSLPQVVGQKRSVSNGACLEEPEFGPLSGVCIAFTDWRDDIGVNVQTAETVDPGVELTASIAGGCAQRLLNAIEGIDRSAAGQRNADRYGTASVIDVVELAIDWSRIAV